MQEFILYHMTLCVHSGALLFNEHTNREAGSDLEGEECYGIVFKKGGYIVKVTKSPT